MSNTEIKVNLCSGPIRLPGWINVDIDQSADVVLDLEKSLLPFANGSINTLVCISAINYFSHDRAIEIIRDVYRVLAPGGTVRFASQDLRKLATHYVNNNTDFWFEKLKNGQDRYAGRTMAEKFNEFFYGFRSGHNHCKYVYDYETLAVIFKDAGFENISDKAFLESSIAEIEKIDNRPEQMFFLEARKPAELKLSVPGESGKDSPNRLLTLDLNNLAGCKLLGDTEWESGRRDRAWQIYMEILNKDHTQVSTVIKAAGISASLGFYKEAEGIFKRAIEMGVTDPQIQARYQEMNRIATATEVSSFEQSSNKLEALKVDQLPVVKGSDLEHLKAGVAWINVAQSITSGGGVSATYGLNDKKWHQDYPETTGYIIPTYLEYYHLTGDYDCLERARRMGLWEIDLQDSAGGVGEPLGIAGRTPRVFNTSQVILGWLALYQELPAETIFLDAAKKSGDWLVRIQEADGRWIKFTYAGPRSYHARTAWSLLAIYKITGEEVYKQAAERSLRWVASLANAEGWFAETSLTDPNKPWTHLTAYTQVGLLKSLQIVPKIDVAGKLLQALITAGETLCKLYWERRERGGSARYVGLPGTFDPQWGSTDTWSCLTGDAQTAYFLRELGLLQPNEEFKKVADEMSEELKRVQIMSNASRTHFGAIPGSYPITGDYCSYSLLNWSVKFYMDLLLQRQLPFAKTGLLG